MGSVFYLPLLIYLTFLTSAMADDITRFDFTNSLPDAWKLEGFKQIEKRGLDASGAWTDALRVAETTAEGTRNGVAITVESDGVFTGNKSAYLEIAARCTTPEDGVAFRVFGGWKKSRIALCKGDTIIAETEVDGLRSQLAPFSMRLFVVNDEVIGTVLQPKGSDWRTAAKALRATIPSDANQPKIQLRSRPANQGAVVKGLTVQAINTLPDIETTSGKPPRSAPKESKSPKNTPKKLKTAAIKLQSADIKDVRIVSNEWICVVIDLTDQIIEKRDSEASLGQQLKKTFAEFRSGKNSWRYEQLHQYSTLNASLTIRSELLKKFEQPNYWAVNGVTVEKASFYPQVIGGFPHGSNGSFSAPEDVSSMPRIAEMVYLKLTKPVKQGDNILTSQDTTANSFSVEDTATVCWSLKVNQLGYLPDAPRKYAYLGAWLGFEGPAHFDSLQGQPFFIHSYQAGADWKTGKANGPALFEGSIQSRKSYTDQTLKEGENVTGEDVFQLEFSSFKTPGHYCIVVPTLGRSWPFQITDDVYGEAFYHVTRALFHQRGTIALERKNTAWTRKSIERPIFQGGYVPETSNFYSKSYGKSGATLGFRDEEGEPVKISPFSMIRSTATKNAFPGHDGGGWHDAADYDRRVHHYKSVWDLCGVFEMYPDHFTDAQLNLPESGNGVPDLLDEACIQIEVFLKTQREDGGVSSWIEQTTHPHESAEKDKRPFYVSLPDRMGSLHFASAAAYLGRLLKPFDSAKSERYLTAATRAYQYGINPEHRIKDIQFTVSEDARDKDLRGKTLTFNESQKLGTTHGGSKNLQQILAEIQLFLGTEDPAYKTAFQKPELIEDLGRAFPDAIHPFAFTSLLLHKGLLNDVERGKLLKDLRKSANKNGLIGQEELPYRPLWRAPDSGYFQYMAWGSIHSAARARLPALLWRITGEEQYREAVLLGLDWELGCNALGRSLTTGIGSVFPVILQHHHSSFDEWLEPIPGYTPFHFNSKVAHQAWKEQYGVIDAGRTSMKEHFEPQAKCLIPKHAGGAALQKLFDEQPRNDDWDNKISKLFRKEIEPKIPIMRRVYIHPYVNPSQMEFTVHESLSAHAAVYAALIPKDWKPDKKLTDRVPRTKASDLPMYPQP